MIASKYLLTLAMIYPGMSAMSAGSSASCRDSILGGTERGASWWAPMPQACPNGSVSDLDMFPAFLRSHVLTHVLLAAERTSLAILTAPLVSHHVPLHFPTLRSPCTTTSRTLLGRTTDTNGTSPLSCISTQCASLTRLHHPLPYSSPFPRASGFLTIHRIRLRLLSRGNHDWWCYVRHARWLPKVRDIQCAEMLTR